MAREAQKPLIDKLKFIDLFGQRPGFKVNGSNAHTSFFGAFLSLCIVVMALAFTAERSIDLYEYQETQFEQYSTPNLPQENDEKIYNYDSTGLNVAIMLVNRDNGTAIQMNDLVRFAEPSAKTIVLEP